MSLCMNSKWIFPVAQIIKNLPAVQETWVRFLGQEDPLDKGMAIHSSILSWRIPWTEEPGGLQFVGSQRVGHDWVTNTATQLLQKTMKLLFGCGIICILPRIIVLSRSMSILKLLIIDLVMDSIWSGGKWIDE